MNTANTTSWTLIRGAAAGNIDDRETFAHRYQPVAIAYLRSRWGEVMADDLDDAVQDVFAECFREQGVLASADSQHGGGFRAFFFGVVRNVARRYESKKVQSPGALPKGRPRCDPIHDLESRQTPESAFEVAWAHAVMKEAKQVQCERAERLGGSAIQRVQLLQLRFEHGLPIREIAKRWNEDASRLHHQYAKAREEFRNALMHVVSGHLGTQDETVDEECRRLLSVLLSDD